MSQLFFAPAVAVTRRLNITGKFLLLGAMSLVAMAVVVYSLYSSLVRIIEPAQRELAGLEILRPLPAVVQALQQHRGLSAGLLSGEEGLRERHAAVHDAVGEALLTMELALPQTLAGGEQWGAIRADWERFHQDGPALTADESFARHGALIDQLLTFMERVAEDYGLTLDPEIGNHHLIDTIVIKLPRTIEYLGRLRAYGTGTLSRGEISAAQQTEIAILSAQLDGALGALKVSLERVGRYNPTLEGLVATATGDIGGAVRQTQQLVNVHLLNGPLATAPADFFRQTTTTIDACYSELHETLLPLAESLITERIERAQWILDLCIVLTLALLTLLAYLSAGISYVVVGNVRALTGAAQRLADGGGYEPVELDACHEFRQVAASFNRLAEGFGALLATSHDNAARLQELSAHLEERVRERTAELEQARQRSDALLARYRTLMTNSIDGIHVMDLQGNIIEANDAFCAMLGYSREEVAALNVSDWDAQWSPEELQERMHQLIDGSATIETRHRRKDGTLIEVEISVSGATLEGESCIIAASRDVTLRKAAEVALMRHKVMIDTALDGFWLTDARGNLLEANAAYARISGYAVEELVGMHISQLEALEESAEVVLAHIEKIIAQGHDRFETRHRRKDGREIDIEVSTTYLPESRQFFAFCHDISERHDAERILLHSQTLLNEAQRLGQLGSWELEAESGELYWSEEVYRIFEQDPSTFHPSYEGFLERIHPEDREMVGRAYERSLVDRQPYDVVHRLLFDDGRIKWVREHCKNVFDADGRPLRSMGAVQDITTQKLAEDALRLAAVTFETHEAILITDARANIIRVNRAFTEITGYRPEEVLGKNPRILSSGRNSKEFYAVMWQALLKNGSWTGEIWDRRQNGEVYPKWLTITAVRNEQGETSEYVAIFSDITERKRAEEEIRNLAFYDPLTQLPNRRLLLDRLHLALAASARNRLYGMVLFIDMDNFKSLNDSLGHEYGDLMLIEVAKRLRACVREVDTVARLGGDEFVILIEGVSDQPERTSQQAGVVAEKVREALAAPYRLNGHTHHSSPSIGVALYLGNAEAVDELLQHADMAMYQAKQAGRNGVRFFDPVMQQSVMAHTELVNDLRDAINDGQLELYYQLQVDNDNRPVGAEALLRWNSPQRGLVMPEQFLPIAEESALILTIDQWVLEGACRQLAAWRDQAGLAELVLTVNVSPKQFAMPDYVDKVAQTLRTHRVKPARLKLELTENMAFRDLPDAVEKMHALKGLGISLSMDDFGTGYTSLFNLKQMPLDQLKLSRKFVRDVASDGCIALLVQNIIDMSNKCRISVIAEGVENEQQLDSLKDHDCVSYQGFLFSKALPIEEFEALMARSR